MMVLFDHGVGREHIVREGLGIVLVQCDQAVGFQDVGGQHIHLLARCSCYCVLGSVLGLLLLEAAETTKKYQPN